LESGGPEQEETGVRGRFQRCCKCCPQGRNGCTFLFLKHAILCLGAIFWVEFFDKSSVSKGGGGLGLHTRSYIHTSSSLLFYVYCSLQVMTDKKFGAGGNVQKGNTLNTAKLDRETEELKHQKVSPTLAKAIQAARLEKKLTQVQLAQQINEPPKVVQEYENQKAIPNPQVLTKMSRVLGVRLTKNM